MCLCRGEELSHTHGRFVTSWGNTASGAALAVGRFGKTGPWPLPGPGGSGPFLPLHPHILLSPRAVLVVGQPRGRPWPCDGGRVWPHSPGDLGMVLPPCWCRVTCLGWGIQGGHRRRCGKGGGSAWLTVLGVAAVALLFEPESPNISALRLRPRCCGFVPFPSVMLLGGLCPGRAGSHLLLLRGKQ